MRRRKREHGNIHFPVPENDAAVFSKRDSYTLHLARLEEAWALNGPLEWDALERDLQAVIDTHIEQAVLRTEKLLEEARNEGRSFASWYERMLATNQRYQVRRVRWGHIAPSNG